MCHWLEKKRQQLEEFKYRNVDVSDPDVQRRIRESEEGLKKDLWYAKVRIYAAVFAVFFFALCSLLNQHFFN